MNEDWEELYRKGDTPWDKGEPAPGLVDFLQSGKAAPPGTVCVPGCGAGHDAREWARRGFDVTGFDIAPTALDRTRSLARQEGLPVRLEQLDFLRAEPAVKFDWIFEHTLFSAINPRDRNLYSEAVRRWLKPGGFYLSIYFFIPDMEEPPYGTNRDEVDALFDNDFELVDDWAPRSWPNRAGEEWMIWRRFLPG